MQPHETPHGKVAAEFAMALVAGNYDRALEMLTASAKSEWDAETLQRTYLEMVKYFASPPNSVQVSEVMTEWPDRQPRDVGWAYAAIVGEGESEAVTVIVSSVSDRHLIRSLEWGRP